MRARRLGTKATSATLPRSRTELTTVLPETPGIGISPAENTSMTRRTSALSKAVPNSSASAWVRL